MDDIEWCERWWKLTENPLYIWQAVALSLQRAEPIPDWCVPYVRDVATHITDLSWLVSRGEVARDHAHGKVPEILGLVRQGAKNAFARLLEDDEAMRAALVHDRSGTQVDHSTARKLNRAERPQNDLGGVSMRRRERGPAVTAADAFSLKRGGEDRAARRLNRGKRMLGLAEQKPPASKAGD